MLWWLKLLEEADKRGIGSETRRWLCQHDLFYLLTSALGRKDVNRNWLFQRCREVQLDPNGHLDLWAREHFKSTIITFALTIQDILNDAEVTVGIFSHTRPTAKAFLRQIKRELESNELLKTLFPDVLWANPQKEAPKWSEDDGIIVKRTGNPKESTVEAWGLVDGQPTGRHFRVRVYDDVVTRESVTTPEQVKKTTEAWELSDNLGSQGGVERYIGTRYHLRDTYAVMLERQVAKPRIYPATHNGRLDGNPVLFTPEQWEAKKNTQRSTLAAQMLQNPLADSDAIFRTDWLRSYEVRPRTLNVYILGDPSKGRSATSDNTAIAVVGIAPGGTKYLLDGYCHRMTQSQRWTALKGLYIKWSAAKGVQHLGVGWERYGLQTDDEYFAERQLMEKISFTIEELNWVRDASSGQSKRDRVERLEPDFRNGRFYLPIAVWHDKRPSHWRVRLENESGAARVIWSDVSDLTSLQQATLDAGGGDLIARAIKRVDEESHVYDLTERFMQEYETFPFGLYDDLIDAVSRIYDMEPTAPVIYRPEQLNPGVYVDS